MPRSKITPFLWFDTNAEEAVNYYASIFPDAAIHNIVRCTEAGPGPIGSVLTIDFELAGQRFVALNGGPHDKFNHAISFFVDCETQEEIDRYWAALTAGGKEIQCGWLEDKFGLAWQIVPRDMTTLIKGPKAMKAMMSMVKIDIATLRAAAEG
jgi:predicted 3-demethylubiquinone-9 3-methyltransferase (glyoxalase superfamily)